MRGLVERRYTIVVEPADGGHFTSRKAAQAVARSVAEAAAAGPVRVEQREVYVHPEFGEFDLGDDVQLAALALVTAEEIEILLTGQCGLPYVDREEHCARHDDDEGVVLDSRREQLYERRHDVCQQLNDCDRLLGVMAQIRERSDWAMEAAVSWASLSTCIESIIEERDQNEEGTDE